MLFSFGLRPPYSRWSDAVLSFLRDVSEPYLRIFRKFIPPIGMFDLSPIVAIDRPLRRRAARREPDPARRSDRSGGSSRRAGSRTAVRRVAYARAGIVVAIVVALDQLTKHLIVANIAPGQVRKLVPGVQLVHWRNTGVAFSALSGGGRDRLRARRRWRCRR